MSAYISNDLESLDRNDLLRTIQTMQSRLDEALRLERRVDRTVRGDRVEAGERAGRGRGRPGRCAGTGGGSAGGCCRVP